MFINFIVVSLCVVFFVLGNPVPSENLQSRNNESTKVRLGIVISPLMSPHTNRELAIYWDISDLQEGDKLVLYNGVPEANGSKSVYSIEPKNARGYQKTRVQSEFVPTSQLTFRERCLKYHVALIRNGMIVRSKCQATHPNWMSEKKSILGSKKLNEIFIPGTHDSGAYYKNEIAKMETLVDKYTITQDEDVLSQLIYGVRYLDIRVGRYLGTDDLWWVNHGYFSVHPLKVIIEDVKHFLNNTQEIVIFDVQEFPVGFKRAILLGFQPNADKKAHEELVAYLQEQFAGYFLTKTTKGWGMSLDEIWATGKRLIIGYDNAQIWPNYESTWQPVTHRWPNVKTLEDLYRKIDRFENGSDPVENFELSDRPPSSVMAQLTPDFTDAVLDILGGLRSMAELVNMNVTDSYNDMWKCSGNIVSMDYIKSSGIIETALDLNDVKFSLCHDDKPPK